MSVCPRGYLHNHTCDLYQFFVHVAYDVARSSSGMLTIAASHVGGKGVTGVHSAGEVTVIYDCLVRFLSGKGLRAISKCLHS